MDLTTSRTLRHCLDQMKDLMIWIGSDGALLHANASALRFYGYTLEDFAKLSIHDLDVHFLRSSWPQHWAALKRNQSLTVTVQHCDSAGKHHAVEIVDTYQCVDGQEFSTAVIRSVEHRHVRSQRQQLMEFSVDQMTDSAMWISADAQIIFANDAVCRSLGYTHDELIKMTVFDIDPMVTRETWPGLWDGLKAKKTRKFESQHRCKNGRLIPVEVHSNLLISGDQEYNCAFVRDITERKVHEAELSRLATHDVLTGLPNRSLLNTSIEHAVSRARRDKKFAAVMMLDLDKFKLVNDNLGHDAGDLLLKEVAARMKTMLRATDTVFRLGGDEFVVVLEGVMHPEDCAGVGQKLIEVITEPLVLGEYSMEVGASIGVAVYPSDGENANDLMKNADIAMYQAKSEGRGKLQFYAQEMGARVSKHLAVVTGLQEALKQNHFVLHYQPIFALDTGRIVAAEALVRWLDPVRGLIPPNDFIPVAEDSGLIGAIGTWVIKETCRQSNQWRQDGLHPVPIAVNLSAYQLRNAEVVEVVRNAMAHSELPPHSISIELTESMVMEDPDRVISILQEIKGLGVTISIDDFGTGYSSLSYLRQFPIDVIKIDRSFVKNIGDDPKEAVIANAIIQLSHSLGCRVLAEGVETKAQGDYLRSQGCDLVQGYFFGRPVPATNFLNFLKP